MAAVEASWWSVTWIKLLMEDISYLYCLWLFGLLTKFKSSTLAFQQQDVLITTEPSAGRANNMGTLC